MEINGSRTRWARRFMFGVPSLAVALAGGCAASRAPAGNACDRKLVTQTDAAEILGGPIVEIKTITGDPQSCEFKAAGFNSVTVTLRPGLGNATVQTWLQGRMPVSATPLQGVGDRAAWVPELDEVVATKANLLCDIQTIGGSKMALRQRVGALCNTIFAAP